jgi:hypothetical protein
MAHKPAFKGLLRAAYAGGGMPVLEIAAAAQVPISTVRRWIKDLPAGAAAANPAVPAELLADIQRGLAMVERELAPGPKDDFCYVWPSAICAKASDVSRLRRALYLVSAGQGVLLLALLALALL